MRKLILPVIVLAHLALLLCIIGPCSAERTPLHRAGEEAPSSAPAGGEEEEAARKAGSEAVSPRPPAAVVFSSSFFTVAEAPLPVPLKGRTDVCRTGIVVDWSNRRILWRKEESKVVPIASLTKLMTVWLLVRDLRERGDLTLAEPVKVTVEASQIGGRQVWLDPRETFSLRDLLKAVMIRSANDCAYLIGQFLGGGDPARFVKRMNAEASALGLVGMKFFNAHGLPPGGGRPENSGRAVELAFLGGLLMQAPEVVKWSSTRLSYIRESTKPFQLVNTNGLVGKVNGVNGMKTGYTKASGFCLVATCRRGDRQMVAVVTGCPSADSRDALVKALLDWAYQIPSGGKGRNP